MSGNFAEFGTFSTKNVSGFWCRNSVPIRLMHAAKGADSAEFQPATGPALEKGWHGVVANITDTRGSAAKLAAVNCVTSWFRRNGCSIAEGLSKRGYWRWRIDRRQFDMNRMVRFFSTRLTVLIVMPFARADDSPASMPPLHSSTQWWTSSWIGTTGRSLSGVIDGAYREERGGVGCSGWRERKFIPQ